MFVKVKSNASSLQGANGDVLQLMSVVKRVVTVLEVKSESYWSSDMLMKLLVSCRLQNTNRNFFV